MIHLKRHSLLVASVLSLATALSTATLFAQPAASEHDPAIVKDLRRCGWISSRAIVNMGHDTAPESLLCFRKTFDVPDLDQVESAWIFFSGDDSATLSLNGTEIGTVGAWPMQDFAVTTGLFPLPLDQLKATGNIFAVRLTNQPQTPIGLIGKVTFFFKDGQPPRFMPMDTSWKFIEGEPPENWMAADFNDSSWAPAIAMQPNTQVIGMVGYRPPVPEPTFPEFLVPGAEKEMASLRDLYNRHLNWFFTCGTLWDAWIPRTVAWPALTDDMGGRAQALAARQYLSLREVTPEGYVSTHQHYGLGHPKGWPFPMWTQSAGKGWHFSLEFVPYRDPFGIFLTTTVDDWKLEGCKTVSLAEPDGWVLDVTDPHGAIISPEIDVAKRSITYVRIEWLAPQLSAESQPYLEWTTNDEPEFSPARRVYFSAPPRAARIPVVTMIKLPEDIDLEARITRLKVGFGNSTPGSITIKAIMTSVETRHNVNNPSFILGMADFTAWTGDLDLLRLSMPKMRTALAYFLKKYRVREEKMVVTPDIGKDGRSGIGFTPDGTKVVTPGRGIGNNYFDILPFGGRDTNATYLIYAALIRMAELEEQVAAHPEWAVEPGALSFDPADLRKLAAEVKETAAPYLFDEKNGRFIGAEDLVDGSRWDYGFVFTNNEAIYYDFALPEQALKIRDWLDGKRIVEGDTSQGEDIYKFRFGPRMTTRRNVDWYIFPWFMPENIPWGGQVQDGGSVLGFSYHDLMAILKVRGPDAAWVRLQEIIRWYDDVQKAGGYLAYYSGKKENEEGSMQGADIGTGGLGIMREFQESLLLPQVMIDGFLGVQPRLDGIRLNPALPAAWPELTITRIGFQGAVYSITAKADGSITVECTAGALFKPGLLFPPDGAWKTSDGRTISAAQAAAGIPLPMKKGESLVLTR